MNCVRGLWVLVLGLLSVCERAPEVISDDSQSFTECVHWKL